MSSDKTFKPTPQRIQQARSKGQVARTRELGPALAFLGVATAAASVRAVTWTDPMVALRRHIDVAGASDFGVAEISAILAEAGVAWAPAALGLLGAAAAGSGLSLVLQGGPAPTSEPLKIDPARLNPLSKLKQMFSLSHAWEVGRALLAAGVAVWVIASALRSELATLNGLMFTNALGLGKLLAEILIGITWRAGLALALLGVLDLYMSQVLHTHKLKMSREDMREEAKQQEGRPEVKAQRRRRLLQLVRSGSIQAVRRADVVVTNPTHYAVALSYQRAAMSAPRVLVKGRDRVAKKIREEARRWDVPIVENPPLAREIYRNVEVDAEIPAELFGAVAEVIAFVMRLRSALPGGAEPGGSDS